MNSYELNASALWNRGLKENCSSVVMKLFAVENWARIEVAEYLVLCLQRLALILVTFSQKPFCTVQSLNLYLRQFNVTRGNEILFANFE